MCGVGLWVWRAESRLIGCRILSLVGDRVFLPLWRGREDLLLDRGLVRKAC